MNESSIKIICSSYQLGEALSAPTICLGGLLHRIYKLDTSKGRFIIKVLNPSLINRPDRINRYRITEFIARNLQDNVPAISALLHQQDPVLQLENEILMVFPYIEATTLPQQAITAVHCKKISQALARIHQANLQVHDAPVIDMPCIDLILDVNQKKQLYALSKETALQLDKCEALIETIYTHCLKHELILKNNTVISHRDCDPKNVLWDAQGDYYLIDWESAGLINKTKDSMATAIYWSLNEGYQFNFAHLAVFLNNYQQQREINPHEVEAGIYGLMGDWLTWLNFNLSRIVGEEPGSDEFNLGIAESQKTLGALPIVMGQIPLVIRIILKQ